MIRDSYDSVDGAFRILASILDLDCHHRSFTFARFVQAVDRAQTNLADRQPTRDFIFVKTEHRLERIALGELLFIEGMRYYRQLHMQTRRLLTSQTFHEFEKQIAPSILCRVHKSFMVSINKIESVEKDVIKIGEHRIRISDTYKKRFLDVVQRPLD